MCVYQLTTCHLCMMCTLYSVCVPAVYTAVPSVYSLCSVRCAMYLICNCSYMLCTPCVCTCCVHPVCNCVYMLCTPRVCTCCVRRVCLPPVAAVLDWDTEDVGQWLDSIGLAEYTTGFLSHDIRGEELLNLGRHDLKVRPLTH